MPMTEYNTISSIDVLLNQKNSVELIRQYGRDLTLTALRQVLDGERKNLRAGKAGRASAAIISEASEMIEAWLRPSIRTVINASGIILHTNLGRAPLSPETIAAMSSVSAAYSNLEYDLVEGRRGSRSIHAESLLQMITDAESALVVNNNAAAILLVLTALAKNKQVIIANSQLIEIGGGFRVPDVLRQSGAKLNAVGTTNRVHLSDYQDALAGQTALVLVAHHSNFRIIGFTTEPNLRDIAQVSKQAGVPLVHDLGSGALLDTSVYGLAHEPTVQESLRDGADLVCFSGDKLLGGPQAGIIVGKKDLLQKIKRHPLARALRADKLILAGISATLTHYLIGEAAQKVPVWRMISMQEKEIKKRASTWKTTLGSGSLQASFSKIGGGSLPEESLTTTVLALQVRQPNLFLEKLRRLNLPIIARIEQDHVLFDPRTVLPEQDGDLISGIQHILY